MRMKNPSRKRSLQAKRPAGNSTQILSPPLLPKQAVHSAALKGRGFTRAEKRSMIRGISVFVSTRPFASLLTY